ncbi:MAG: head-tail connector protein [Pseudomonadota bacterium]
MNLIELTSPAAEDYPVRALADHLRLGTGFSDDGSLDQLLEAYLRTAVASIEGRTGKITLTRDYAWEIARWATCERQGLPLAPVTAVTRVALIGRDGTETDVSPESYGLRQDSQRPTLEAVALPTIPTLGTVRIEFTAGFGADWEDSPADLRQAILMLAAHYFEHRTATGARLRELPFGVLQLIERFRPMRLLGDRL